MTADAPGELGATLPAVPDSVPLMRNQVTRYAAAAGASGLVLDGVRLAVTEAVTNTIMHAYVDDPQPGTVTVAATVEEGALRLRVSDRGRGMLPRPDSPGLGLGLPLIAQAADSFDVHEPSEGGVELLMSFDLGEPAEAPMTP